MDNKNEQPEFDRYATQYRELHNASIAASGEESKYFAEYKAKVAMVELGEAAQAPISVLDFGTGIGGSIGPLRRALPNAVLHGADISSESVAMAQERHGDHAIFSVIADDKLPYADASFDMVFVACVYHHIPVEQRGHWTTEIHRVLKPGGHILVFEHNMLNPLTMKVVRDCAFDEDAILLPRRELLDLVGQPFNEVRARYIVFFPKTLAFLRSAERSLWWLPLGAQYYVHARA
ncbi:class I SAM-dependent methyltransferase [Lysobacter sp. H21R4]|uniref:class I SAM-dependent methyltransferase n=1 Tax=Lysobacter sp. H21R4 TaxID=2781021 RepID=UPI0018891F1E|nr:class I SAM-dependent methyltransferase [Lysobacter sp. H21R4]QOY62382.1 class I SAM-dependent methyltransferase [Lysobacter sp. H21R4]